MKSKMICIALALGASVCLVTAQDEKPAPGGPPSANGEGGQADLDKQHGGPGGFHLLPPHAEKQLNLTAIQKKELAELEAHVKVRIDKILTPEQLELLKQMRPPHPPTAPPAAPGGQGSSDGQGEGQPQKPASE